MAYTKRHDIPVAPGETAVELDTGDLVAVRCDRKRVDAGVCYHPQARAVDPSGETRRDAMERGIATGFKHAVGVDKVDALGDDTITRECLLAVLGEPATTISWAPELLAAASIRVSLVAAAVSGPADAGAVL